MSISLLLYLFINRSKYEKFSNCIFSSKRGDVKETLKIALPETRSFDGCISVDTYIEDSTNTVHLIEDWESLDHQSKYLNWRIETGLLGVLEPLLEGGAAGLKAIICGPKHDTI